MENKDEYLVYTSPNHDTFYFKNKKLHREIGPAIVCRKDANKKIYAGLPDESLYTRVFEPVEPNEQNDIILFETYHCDSSYYLEGIRYSAEHAMHKAKAEKEKNELNQELQINIQESNSKKLKI